MVTRYAPQIVDETSKNRIYIYIYIYIHIYIYMRTKRHNALCDVLFNALWWMILREMRCDSISEARPGDIFHPDFERGLPTYFDLTVRNSLQPAYLIKAATCAGAAAETGELEKDQRHDSLVSSTGSIFYPIVVESLGLWSPNSLQVLKTIARRISFHNNATVSQCMCHLLQQLSCKLWLYNARMILARVDLDSNVG